MQYANIPMHYAEIFKRGKTITFRWKVLDIILIFAQNIDRGYTLRSPKWGGSNEYPQSML